MCPYEKKVTKNKLTNNPDLIEFLEISFEMNQIRMLEPIRNPRGNMIS